MYFSRNSGITRYSGHFAADGRIHYYESRLYFIDYSEEVIQCTVTKIEIFTPSENVLIVYYPQLFISSDFVQYIFISTRWRPIQTVFFS